MGNNDIVIMELDRPRELRLTHKVLKRFSAKEKLSLTKIPEAMEDYNRLTDLVCMMLQADDPSLTQEQCDELLEEIPVVEIVKKASEAIAAGLGAEEEKPENEENAEEGGEGENPITAVT